MSLEEFGRMVAAGMKAKGMGQGKLAVMIGVLPDGKTLDATQIRLIMQGRRRALSGVLVQRIAEVLGLDPAEAHYQAGTWPPGLDPEDLRDISERAATRTMTAAGRVATQQRGHDFAAYPSSTDQHDSTMGTWTVFAPKHRARAA